MTPKQRRDRLRRGWPGRALLRALSWGYAFGVWARRRLYEARLLKSSRLPAKVICIGNLTTGGTGKTPAVLLAAQTLRKRNHSVAILSRGYGRAQKDAPITTLLDDNPPPWTECGDEPWMMHHALAGQNVPILVCPDRARAGREAIQYYHSRLLILDDGFQHHRLERDLDIVLVNAADPFGGDALLPLGDLREPLSGLARAHLILVTHADTVSPEVLEGIKARLRESNAAAPILESAHKADFLLDLRGETKHRLSHLEGKDVVAFCGLGDPAQFEEQLGRIGANVVQRWRYPDHHAYSPAELRALDKVRDGRPAVTTFKDFVRFPREWKRLLGPEVYALSIKLEILKGRNVWIDSLLKLAGGER